jgi:hypothetical protein
MCDIAGFVRAKRETSPHEETLVDQVCQTIIHRGPDDGGIYLRRGVGFLGYNTDPVTAFTYVQKLPPAYLLEFAAGTPKIRQALELGG